MLESDEVIGVRHAVGDGRKEEADIFKRPWIYLQYKYSMLAFQFFGVSELRRSNAQGRRRRVQRPFHEPAKDPDRMPWHSFSVYQGRCPSSARGHRDQLDGKPQHRKQRTWPSDKRGGHNIKAVRYAARCAKRTLKTFVPAICLWRGADKAVSRLPWRAKAGTLQKPDAMLMVIMIVTSKHSTTTLSSEPDTAETHSSKTRMSDRDGAINGLHWRIS
nr:hypothetical protein CFP56_50338 [Quercus suber]